MRKFLRSVLPKSLVKKYRIYKEQQKWNALYKGNDVHCPLCKSSFKVFATYGLENRENAKCHNCGSLERDRLLYLYLSEHENIFNPDIEQTKLLHFAPEKVFYTLIDPNPNISYTTCDLSPERYDYGGKSKIKKADITNIPFEDNSFDFILCNHVLEHIPDDHLAMTELHRVLSHGGSGIFQVPIDYSREETYEDWNITSPEEREKAFGQHDHVRWYGQDYKTRLEKAGFTVNEVDYISQFLESDVYKYGFMKSEKIYHCSKK